MGDIIAAKIATGSDERFRKTVTRATARLWKENSHQCSVPELFSVQLTLTLDLLWETMKEVSVRPDLPVFQRALSDAAALVAAGAHRPADADGGGR